MTRRDLLFFKISKNSKIPIKNEKFSDKKTLKQLCDINTTLYNVGLSCEANNLLILDIDEKNEGLTEWTEYITMYDEPLTVKQQSPNNGYHLLFNENNELYTEEENLLIKRLVNKAGYRNKGLDIRKGNGYIVCEPSTINNKKYKFIRHYKNNEILNMPLSLIKWLLEKEKIENININVKNNNNLLIIMKDEDDLIIMLENLSEYIDNSKNWIKITASIKNLLHIYNDFTELQLFNIWDNWSKKGKKYNKENNITIWNNITLDTNFNYFVDKCNKTSEKSNKINLFKTIKDYVPILKDISTIKTINMSNHHIYDAKYKGKQLTEKIFNDNSTIIIESTTGTGKTSNVALFCKKYELSNKLKECAEVHKILSIVSRVSLASQHIESFKQENINMLSYLDDIEIEDNNIVICLNSILRLSRYEPEFFNNYIVYIDEINTFTRHLTHNNLLNSTLKLIYTTLMKIINNCHKLILSESIISDNVFNLCSKRPDALKVYIINSFKKYQDIEATKHNDENFFLESVIKHVETNDYFLFGCDSKDIITKYYNECYKICPDKCLLITGDTKTILNNVNEQFKDKFIFYSPSITCGINFDIEIKQDVFLYINGKTLEPCDSFQQATRTRNIKTLNYYINEPTKDYIPKFNNLKETYEYISNVKNIHNDNLLNVVNMCYNIDENDDYKFNENTFFKLFGYNEYLTDIYKTNKEYHFRQILKTNGYIMKELGKINKLKPAKKAKMKKDKNNYIDKKFNDHIQNIQIDANINDKIEFLKLDTIELREKYQKVVTDDYLKNDYLNLIKLFYDETLLNSKLMALNKNNVEYKAIYSNYNKIKLLSSLEKEAHINRFEIEHKEINEPVHISDILYNKIKIAFNSIEKKPLFYNDFINYYVCKLKHILGKTNIINKKNIQINKVRRVRYSINETELKYYMDLNYLRNSSRDSYNPQLLQKFKNIIALRDISEDVIYNDIFYDDDDDYENYNINNNDKNNLKKEVL